jgi:hypothetical protein
VRGHTLIDVMVALGVLGILAGTALHGGEAHLAAIGHDRDDLRAAHAATSRLEALDPARLEPGIRTFVPFPGARGVEEVREREPGLREVTVRVRAGSSGPLAECTTLVAVEPPR